MKRPKEFETVDFSTLQQESDELVETIKRLLAGKQPMAVGMALAELTAMLLAGYDESRRSKVLELHITTVLDLYPQIAAQIWMRNRKKKEKETP